MTKTQFTLEYWKDGGWLVGRAYALLRRDHSRHKRALTKPIQIAA